ncbi:hypothetical protein AX16_003190 [Volvariella volvacea WC 439]|nr:hypothetical protein AX16_003190 [Volvariella volvacea WC 439]
MSAAAKSKTSKAASNNKGKPTKNASTNGTATPVAALEKKDTLGITLLEYTSGKPDKKLYDEEQDRIKTEISSAQNKLSEVKDKISSAQSGGSNERKNELRKELEEVREQQGQHKVSRGKLHDQVKMLEDNIQKKVKDLQTARAKTPFRTVADLDAAINQLQKQVESGTLKLVDEKKALRDITLHRGTRRVVEGFQADQDWIDAEREKVKELRKQLEDPEVKALSERYEGIKAELDRIKQQDDEAYNNRSKLIEERDKYQAIVNDLYSLKRESAQRFREANDKYWAKVHEDRARREERIRSQRAAEQLAKKREVAQRLREEAEIPAFQAQIEDCQTLIDFFSGKTTGNVALKSTSDASSAPSSGLVNVPKLELRKVDDIPEGAIVRKKKGEEEEAYFVAGKGKNKGGKKGGKTNGSTGTVTPTGTPTSTPANDKLNVPLPLLSAILSLSIPPPASATDVPRVIQDLSIKKAWFEANQARVTAENIAKAEAEIKRLNGEDTEMSNDGAGGAAESEPTPVVDPTTPGVPASEVAEQPQVAADEA